MAKHAQTCAAQNFPVSWEASRHAKGHGDAMQAQQLPISVHQQRSAAMLAQGNEPVRQGGCGRQQWGTT